MRSDQIEETVALVREVLEAGPKRALCATFEVAGNDAAWAQVTADAINVAYPSDVAPGERLGALLKDPSCTGVSEWEPMKFVTLSLRTPAAEPVVNLVDALLTELFQLDAYAVTSSVQEL